MRTTISQVYVFENGTRIDLSKVIAIGAIEKDLDYNLIIKIYCSGGVKPIIFILGNSIGKVSDENKKRIEKVYSDFVTAWEGFLLLCNELEKRAEDYHTRLANVTAENYKLVAELKHLKK